MSRVKHAAYPLRARTRPFGHATFGVLLGLWLAHTALAQTPTAPAVDETQVIAEDSENSSPAAPATAAKNGPVLSVPARLAEERRQLLSQMRGPPTPMWLPVNGGEVLAFWQPDRSGKPLGAVLMLHSEGDNPRRTATLRRLHENLPLHGWATFSMQLPDLPEQTVPPRPVPAPGTAPAQGEAAAPETDKTEAVDETQIVHQEADEPVAAAVEPAQVAPPEPQMSREEVLEHIQQRIQAATAYLHQQGQFNLVLLGEGQSALWVLQHLEKAVPPSPVESADKKSKAVIDRAIRAVVLVNVPTAMEIEPLTEWLRHPQVPTFDVFTDLDLDALAAAQKRHQAAKQKGYENYVQRRLPPPKGANRDTEETSLTKAVRGFLQKHAKGVELK